MSESRPIEVGFRKPPDTPRPGPTVRARPLHVQGGVARARADVLVTEEPLEIRVQHRDAEHQIAVTMRTPGSDFELAVGFLFGEGLIRAREDITTVSYCKSGPPEQLYNIVTVELAPSVPFDPAPATRAFTTTSACGVCGKSSLDAIAVRATPLPEGPVIDASLIPRLPDALRARQKLFDKTGGLHAAGIFDVTGEPVLVREDVGRHNAVDKVAGALLLAGDLPARDRILQVSGRASFEIMQKALAAGIRIVASVSAPSSLAVDVAERFGMTLAGFVRGQAFNVYAGPSRIRFASA